MPCKLSPSASAFSAMLSAFIGSIINGISSGWFVAFMTGWISWFALFRVLVGATYMLYRSITGTWEPEYDLVGQAEEESYPMTSQQSQQDVFRGTLGYGGYQSYGGNNLNDTAVYPAPQQSLRPKPGFQQSQPGFFNAVWPSASAVRAFKLRAPQNASSRNPWGPLNRDVSFLGWLGWVWTGLYAPISQIIWLVANSSNHTHGFAKIVKGLTVAVTALPLCIDSKVRYGEKLAGPGRSWVKNAFNIVNALSCLLQGILCAVLLITGVVDLVNSSSFGFPLPILAIYPIFSLIWMFLSFRLLPIRDGGRRRAAQRHWLGIFADIGVGAFAGLFVAVPAFALWQSSSFNERYADWSTGSFGGSSSSSDAGSSLSEYLQCEMQVWRKFAAIFP